MIQLALFSIAVLCSAFVIAVLRGSGSRWDVKGIFALLCACMAVWSVGVAVFLGSDSEAVRRVSSVVYYAAAAIFAALLFVFALFFPRPSRRLPLRSLVGAAIAIVLVELSWLFMPGEGIVASSWRKGAEVFATIDQARYGVFSLLFILFFALGIALMLANIATTKGKVRTQSALYMIAVLLMSIPGFYANLWLPYQGNYTYIWAGPAAVVIFLMLTAYNIVWHGLFEVRATAMRATAYTLSIVTMALLYFGMAYVVSIALFGGVATTGVSMSPVNIVLALILAVAFQPIKRFFDHVTNRIFYHDSYDTEEFIGAFGRILTSTSQLHELLAQALDEIVPTLKAGAGTFVVYRDHHDDVLVGTHDRSDFTEHEYELLRSFVRLTGSGDVCVVDESKSAATDVGRLFRMLRRKKIAVVLPLIGADETIGYLLLGDQRGTGYAKRDMRLLQTIANELVIAITNARSVQVVRDLNTHLEERVSHATRQLQRNNKRLLELDETKDEFLSMASHQLRTPLTSVKGYISMVLEGDVGDIAPAQRHLLEEAYTSSERMVHLIGDFLNVSRLQTGRFIVDPKHSNLAKLVRQEVDSIQPIAKTHGITVTYTEPARFPELYIDEGKIRQVVMNFIDNAIYYSPESTGIKVTLRIEDGDAVVRVIDKGMGVPTDVQKKLFSKFFRAENARRQRPDGTGIGLYLAKKIIDGHGGALVFESVEGKGSTFGFRLPIRKLSTPPPPQLITE